MENHLIIGLGGTGGKIIRSLRKLVYQRFRSNNPNNGVHVDYLYVDSSRDEMNKIDDWEVLGNSVEIGEGSFLELQSTNLSARLEEIERFPGLRDFIGDKKDWLDLLNDSKGTKTAGMQRRRMGRILFACSAQRFANTLSQKVGELSSASGSTAVTFHVCAGLAGGTGSGSIIDAIAQIRNKYPDVNSYRIMVYVYVPEDDTSWNADGNFYHSNGYAALVELNALAEGNLKPHDVLGEKGRLTLEAPFTGCYLFSKDNENNVAVDQSKELPAIVADFIYQKTIGFTQISGNAQRFFESENNPPVAEKNAETNAPERSRRFLSFGIKRLAVPEEEIREYLTFSLAEQAASQLRFNNWNKDTGGFQNEPTNQNFHEFVKREDNLSRWGVSLKHLMLSTQIIMDDTTNLKWKEFGRHWKDQINYYKGLTKEKDKVLWNDTLKGLCVKHYDEEYRKADGVVKFFATKRKDRNDLANAIRKMIENELFGEWQNGQFSLSDLRRKLDALIEYLRDDLLKSLDGQITTKQTNEERYALEVTTNDAEWAKIGVLADIFGKREKILDAQEIALEKLYRIRTEIEGLKFAKDLLPVVLDRLAFLSDDLTSTESTVSDGIKEFEGNILLRCNDEEINLENAKAFQGQLVKIYEPERVKNITKQYVRDENFSKNQAAKVRNRLVEKLSGELSFGGFNRRISKGTFLRELEMVCQDTAQKIDEGAPVSNKIMGMGVIERLEQRFGSNQSELRKFVKRIMDYAGCFTTFNTNEISKQGAGTGSGELKRGFFVVLPKRAEHLEFTKVLMEALNFGKTGGLTIDPIFSESSDYYISFMTLTYGFPLRYASRTDTLRNLYKLRINKEDSKIAKMMLHTEGDGSSLPPLFVRTKQEEEDELQNMRQLVLPHFLLAQVFGKMKEMEDDNGYKKLAFVELDRFGEETPKFFMDKQFLSSWKSLSRTQVEQISTAVDKERENKPHRKQKEETAAALIKLVSGLRSEITINEDYNKVKAAASDLIDELEK